MKQQLDREAIDQRGYLTEEDVWEAIAEDLGLDYWEIADGDKRSTVINLSEYL